MYTEDNVELGGMHMINTVPLCLNLRIVFGVTKYPLMYITYGLICIY